MEYNYIYWTDTLLIVCIACTHHLDICIKPTWINLHSETVNISLDFMSCSVYNIHGNQ